MAEIELLNPIVLSATEIVKPTVRGLDTLENKTAGIMYTYVDWRGFHLFADRLKVLLKSRYNVKDVIEFKSLAAYQSGPADVQSEQETKEKVFGRMARSVDFAIIGAAFCGSCTYYTAEATAEATSRHIPALGVTSTSFESLFRSVARAKGFDDLNVLVLPGDINILPAEEINKITDERLLEIEARILGKTKVEVKRDE